MPAVLWPWTAEGPAEQHGALRFEVWRLLRPAQGPRGLGPLGHAWGIPAQLMERGHVQKRMPEREGMREPLGQGERRRVPLRRLLGIAQQPHDL
jgi:hypothetical protein